MSTTGSELDPRIKRARELIAREDFAKAWPIASDVLNDTPDSAPALYLSAAILRGQGHPGMALALFRRALALAPKQPSCLMHYGACLHDTHQYEEAREAFHMVRKLLPDDPMPLGNLAASYVQQGRAREAVEWAAKALALDPNHRIANVAMGFGCLALGRWAEGWKHAEYLYGENILIRVYNREEDEEPVWDGSKGKTVVVQADQGLGDVIMFSQCLPQMVKDCKKVIIECAGRLVGMLKRNFPDVDVYGTIHDSNLEWPKQYKIDARIHISLLGRFYRTTDADFPRQAYISPDAAKAAHWRKWLEQFPRPWVGIAWKGGIIRTNWKARSIELAQFAPIIKQGGTFISLAYQDVGIEIARWNIDNPQQVIVPPIDNSGDFDEWVALIAGLDDVVTVTTTAAHVCGALGKRARVLVNQNPQWRYVYGGDSLLWYPENSLSLYRQKPGETDWTHALARLGRDYSAFTLGKV